MSENEIQFSALPSKKEEAFWDREYAIQQKEEARFMKKLNYKLSLIKLIEKNLKEDKEKK